MTNFDYHQVELPHDLIEDDVVRPTSQVAFTEGPAAAADGMVYFSDIINNRIMRLDSHTGRTDVWRIPSGRANGLLFDAEGRLLACEGNEFGENDGHRRITRTEMNTGRIEVLTDRFEGQRFNAPNDIAACSNGNILFTDPAYGCREYMDMDNDSVYLLTPEGNVSKVITQPNIQRPNGIAISPDEQTLYLVDSCPTIGGNRKIWAFDLADDGTVSHQRLVHDFAPGRGGDGMAVDQQGNLWIAAGIRFPRGPHETTNVPPAIWVITPGGDILGRIPIPEDVLTNVTFGGDDLKTLYVAAGKSVYSMRVKVPGFVVHRRPNRSISTTNS